MACVLSFKDLSRHIDGADAPKERQRIESHLKGCQHCKQATEGLLLLKASLSALPAVKESSDFDFVFNQKLNKRLQEKASFSLNEIMQRSLSGLKDAFMPKAPVLVRVSALFILIFAVMFGSYNYYIYGNLPIIETINGEAKIYKQDTKAYITARPNMRLRENYRIETANGAVLNIISKGKYAARIKEDSDIRIAKLDVRHKNQMTGFDIKYGKLMVNTTDAFKGSAMLLSSPACKAKVVGTAFAVDVDKTSGGTTWLGVLEGKVKVTSQGKDVYVEAGQKTQVEPNSLPDVPTLLSDSEWYYIQELYQLGEKPQVVLLVSTRETRVYELLRPAPLYILDTAPRTIPRELEAIITIINKAIEDNGIETHKFAIERLEGLVELHSNPKYNPQFLMFIGSYYYYVGDYKKAVETFEKVVNEYPDYVLSSLAQRAIVEIYQHNLNDEAKAKAAIRKLLERYPYSIDSKKFTE